MANFVASDVTYTINKIKKLEDGRKIVNATLAFGNGVKTYAAGGVPILPGNLGCPNVIDSFAFAGTPTVGYGFQYDYATQSLMLLTTEFAAHTHSTPAHAHDLLLKNAVVADGATTSVNAGANLLGANTGADITVSGGGASGGVQTLVAGVSGSTGPTVNNLVEPVAVAIAAQSVNVVVIGY